MSLLVIGGAGYIGSTVASAARDAGHEVVVIDNLTVGREEFTAGCAFYRGDMADGELVDQVFAEHAGIDAVVHCAALTVVPDSVAEPLRYYRENVAKTVELLDHLRRNGCRRVVFSSSASVYGDAGPVVDEDTPLAPGSPYARTKVMVEQVLADVAAAQAGWQVLALRYFNPIGADPRRRSGPTSPRPSHVLGKLLTAAADDEPFVITGTDYPTRDGSGLRDYVHVWDLAQAHVAAIEKLDDVVGVDRPYLVVNLGSGTGVTVRELAAAVNRRVNPQVRVHEGPRRPGDPAGAVATIERARTLLGWSPTSTLDDAVRDALAWQTHGIARR
jgi:UDP-glucose 4-epimerase